MKHVRRAAAVTGGAVAALALAGTGQAFAWNPSDASLTVGCRPDAGHVELVLGNNYKDEGDYTLSQIGGTEVHRGKIGAHKTVKVTVGYSGHGDDWRYTLADTHVDKHIADVPLCPSATPSQPATPTPPVTPSQPATPSVPATPTASRSVTPSPSGSPSATPSGTPSSPAAQPSGSPSVTAEASASPSAGPVLAQTGGGGNTTLAVAGAATLAAGAGLVLAARRVSARRKA
ncbi:LPXTG cell wall anchor domain-containing protein [Kitasatospora sp. NPDC089797]|uniref:LPXTG cell wall anchor domain-containing protein n=1 Tax=Kitasatospora sp. NPDC089797 TaxID=3155298 RepID=UPI0034272BC5